MTKNHDTSDTYKKAKATLEIDRPQIPTVRSAIDQLRSRMNVGRLVMNYRVKLGLTQQALAQLAGTKQGRISEIETLEGNVTFETLDKVTFALGLEVTLRERSPEQAIITFNNGDDKRIYAYTESFAGYSKSFECSLQLQSENTNLALTS